MKWHRKNNYMIKQQQQALIEKYMGMNRKIIYYAKQHNPQQ